MVSHLIKNKVTENLLWKHCVVQHNGEIAEFEMKIVGQFRSCLERQTNEAVRITGSKAEMVLNSKSEWHQTPLVRVIPVTGLMNDQIGVRRLGV